MDWFDWLYEAASQRKGTQRLTPTKPEPPKQPQESPAHPILDISYVPRLRHLESLNLLVVDDVPASCKLLGSLLKELGVKTEKLFLAYSVGQAKATLRRIPIDIVFSDLNLPRHTGVDLLRSMRNHPFTFSTPFILVTNCPDERSVHEARKLGALSVISKPFSIASVTNELLRACDSAKHHHGKTVQKAHS
jgi:two-component system cell cycle response regulator DivK